MHPTDLIIFWTVVLARFLIPLLIFRYPLPAILAALVLDGVDQSIFQTYTSLPLEGYQGYDKALDIYYLTIAYIATMRNWTNYFAFETSRFLYYYRLVGIVLFEFLHLRWLMLIFPNTFEYFFIFYEAVRARWDPRRMSKRLVIGATAFIWIFIKLPQEAWIHIFKLDATDFIKETLYGVPTDSDWVTTLSAKPALTFGIIAAVVLLIVAAWWVITRKLPPADWSLKFKADPLPEAMDEASERARMRAQDKLFNTALLEKLVLISFVSLIFGQILPDRTGTTMQLLVGVVVVVVINAFLSQWMALRGRSTKSTALKFVIMAVVNFIIVLIFVFILPSYSGSLNLVDTLFFMLLLTLLVVLFDMYHPVYRYRLNEAKQAKTQQGAA